MLSRTARSISIPVMVIALLIRIYVFAAADDSITGLKIPPEGAKEKMGNIYYIDAANGMDSNDGLSPEKAWRTIRKANNAKLDPGSSVLLKRGEAWREQLIAQSGDETGYVKYGAYGDGDKPILLGSVTRNKASDWTHEGQNIWATIPPELDADELLPNPSFATDTDGWHLYCEGDADAVGGRDASDYDSSPASYGIDCRTQGSGASNIQFYTTGISIEQGYYYKFSFSAKSTVEFSIDSINLMKPDSPWTSYYSYRSRSPLNIQENWATYEVLFRASETAQNARITFFLGSSLPEGAVFHIDSLSFRRLLADDMLSVDVGNLILNNEESVGVKVWNQEDMDSQGEFWYDDSTHRLYIRLPGDVDPNGKHPADYYSNIECALRKHIIDEGGKSYIIFENLDLRYGGAHGIGGGSTHHIIVRNCDLSYIGGGDQMGGDRTVRFGNGID